MWIAASVQEYRRSFLLRCLAICNYFLANFFASKYNVIGAESYFCNVGCFESFLSCQFRQKSILWLKIIFRTEAMFTAKVWKKILLSGSFADNPEVCWRALQLKLAKRVLLSGSFADNPEVCWRNLQLKLAKRVLLSGNLAGNPEVCWRNLQLKLAKRSSLSGNPKNFRRDWVEIYR